MIFFFNSSPKAKQKKKKKKKKKVGLGQPTKILHRKEINKKKRQVAEWETVFANHISDEWLMFKIYKEFKQLVK